MSMYNKATVTKTGLICAGCSKSVKMNSEVLVDLDTRYITLVWHPHCAIAMLKNEIVELAILASELTKKVN